MKINYLKGDATKPEVKNKDVIIAHISNSKGGWGAGFVLAISKKWKLPEQKYRAWAKEKDYKLPLGEVQFVPVGGQIHVANMIAQDGFGGVAVKYDHLRECLKQVYDYAIKNNAVVCGPRFGSGLGGGNWDVIEKIVEEELCEKGIEVTIYDFA